MVLRARVRQPGGRITNSTATGEVKRSRSGGYASGRRGGGVAAPRGCRAGAAWQGGGAPFPRARFAGRSSKGGRARGGGGSSLGRWMAGGMYGQRPGTSSSSEESPAAPGSLDVAKWLGAIGLDASGEERISWSMVQLKARPDGSGWRGGDGARERGPVGQPRRNLSEHDSVGSARTQMNTLGSKAQPLRVTCFYQEVYVLSTPSNQMLTR